jgi:diadenylate cyclase
VEVVRACQDLSESRFGALIVFERNTGLRDYTDTGTLLEAAVSDHLLTTVFTPHTPLHDGAVVIRGETLVAAGCILPLSQDPLLARTTGMRHRAAIGITEVTDAVSVVVSEETGGISLAIDGSLKGGLDPATLREELNRALAVSTPAREPAES